MAVLKCKMCGGDLAILEGASTAECEYCGSVQTVPTGDDEKKLVQFERADHLRRQCQFDKAAGIYEAIVADFRHEAEAYWGLVLCKYGIEYVDDPATGKKIPTCHRSSFDSIMEDSDLELALENADIMARRVYREEAKQIEQIRKGIIAVSANEKPYDIFICYKETDENGERTLDSVLAQDVYDALTDKGYRVFFSRITLEDKLGVEYEPYIFAALNSAKIMLAFGTDYEYYNAVWVKNEWSRFLKLMVSDKQKRLIPCYKGIDAYDMPKEFAKLQAQDLGKVGAIQDLLRGIEKLLPRNKQEKETVVHQSATAIDPLLQRVFLFLEDGEWDNADEYCEKVLDLEPQNAIAYLGKLMAELQVSHQEDLAQQKTPFAENGNYKKVLRFADAALRGQLEDYNAAIAARMLAQKEVWKANMDKLRGKALQNWLSGGRNFTVGLRSDGTVCATHFTCSDVWLHEQQCDTKKWRDIVAVSAGVYHTVGLRSDGTVEAVGMVANQDHGRCMVGDWKNIKQIAAGMSHTVGLRGDGTVVATRFTGDRKHYLGQCEVSDWKDIVAISAGSSHTVGLRKDGTVVATKFIASTPLHRQCDVDAWRDIVAVSAGGGRTVGLRKDGTVVVANYASLGPQAQCDVDAWRDIVAVSAGEDHIVGLKADGTVVAVGYNRCGACNVSQWRDVVAIYAGYNNTVGLLQDGTVVATGISYESLNVGQSDVGEWKLFDNLQNLEEEKVTARQRRKELDQKAAQWRGAGKCQYCGGALKGFLMKKCVSCGKDKDY